MNHTNSDPESYHVPVMPREVIEYLIPSPGKTILDATLGFAGHSVLIAAMLAPGGTLIGIDRDLTALQAAEIRLEPFRSDIAILTRHTEFGNIEQVLRDLGGGIALKLDGALIDAGASSYQLDHAPGFSFRRDEYLDGRMNRTGSGKTVADIIAESGEQELARIFWEYGEERNSRRIARSITELKASGTVITTTGQLVKVVEKAVPRSQWPKDRHVATKVFQSLRIECNSELDQLEAGLNAIIDNLKPGGRVVGIGFHSLEDRIFKETFARRAGKQPSPSGYSMAALAPNIGRDNPDLTIVTRKPVTADDDEVRQNIRARSAKLRCAERNT